MGEAIKNVRLVFTESDHARLRVAAAKAGESMASYSQRAVLRAIEADERGESEEAKPAPSPAPSKRRGRPRKVADEGESG